MKIILCIIAIVLGGGWTTIRFEFQQSGPLVHIMLIISMISLLCAVCGTWRKLLALMGLILLLMAGLSMLEETMLWSHFVIPLALSICCFIAIPRITFGARIVSRQKPEYG